VLLAKRLSPDRQEENLRYCNLYFWPAINLETAIAGAPAEEVLAVPFE
jgi:hypothetical protein